MGTLTMIEVIDHINASPELVGYEKDILYIVSIFNR